MYISNTKFQWQTVKSKTQTNEANLEYINKIDVLCGLLHDPVGKTVKTASVKTLS